mgnify:CR=1 FL=1
MLRIIDRASCRETGKLNSKEINLDKSRIWYVFKRKVRVAVGRRYLGLAWIPLNPIVRSLVYLFVFNVIRSNPDISVLLIGITMYTMFTDSFKSGMNSINDYTGGIKAERVRTRVLMFSMLYFRSFDAFLQASGVAIILFLVIGIKPLGVAIFIIISVTLSILSEGLALNISTATKSIPDLGNVINYVLLLGFFSSPALYSLNDTTGWHYRFNLYNPFTYFVEGARHASGVDSPFREIIGPKLLIILFMMVVLAWRGYNSLDEQRWRTSSWS